MTDGVKVEVYCADGCDYCEGAISLLERKGMDFVRYRVDLDDALRAEMEQRAGRSSVPQVFIDDRHVGGFDDMVELDIEGELDSLLGLT